MMERGNKHVLMGTYTYGQMLIFSITGPLPNLKFKGNFFLSLVLLSEPFLNWMCCDVSFMSCTCGRSLV